MSPTPTEPAAQGTLANTPFAHLVLYLYQRRSSGTLVVRAARTSSVGSETPARREPVKVLFHRGRAVAAYVGGPADALDHALLPLCAMRDGDYEFFEEDQVGSGPAVVTGMFDPYAFVTDAARRFTPKQVIDQVLSRFSDVPLCVQPGMDLERMLLDPQEARFAEVLREGTATMGTLLQARELPEQHAQRVLYALLVTKVVGAFAATQEEVGSGPPPGAASLRPSSSSDAPANNNSNMTHDQRRRQSSAAWAAIAARASQASRAPSGPVSEAARSYTPSRSFTPPARAASSTPAPSKTPSQRATATSSRPPGRRSLSPPRAFGVRRTPLRPETPSAPPGRVIDQPLETPRPVSGAVPNSATPRGTTPSRPISRVTPRAGSEPVEALDPAGKLRRVQALCQRNAFDEALPIIRGLVESERRNPEYLGMLASVLYGRGLEGTISKEIVDSVNQALRIHPDEVNALYTKARCYKRMGKNREALHYFRRTVAVDPAHLDAAREVRLLMLRQAEKPKR